MHKIRCGQKRLSNTQQYTTARERHNRAGRYQRSEGLLHPLPRLDSGFESMPSRTDASGHALLNSLGLGAGGAGGCPRLEGSQSIVDATRGGGFDHL